MKIGTKILILFLTLNLLSCKSSAQETETKKVKTELDLSTIKKSKFPRAIGYVNDFENIFTINQRIKLDKTIGTYEIESTNEIAIVTIESIKPYENIKAYASELSNDWGIGKAEKNNGLLILFSKSLGKIQISTGTGTEKILTDKICKKVIDQIIIPEFKKGDFHSGIKKGLEELIIRWK
ncbi:TPM domain-containing protein [Polaribacter sp. PL03]|uniref:TPM domain-containing protein n=1 Tax=Polaribacter sp. PL03 TaxID=3088353 RepID=UPI0029CECE1C|nr:TPM domain-containing protein [Polaribacter sp. PL03]MDX6748058.1 TPM domain-containing protein [Polaribacter sp. PL03]